LFILSFLSNINVPFHYGITKPSAEENDTICDIIPEYRKIYMKFAITTMITVYLLPMCIIGLINSLICCKLWRKSLLMEHDGRIKIKKERYTSRISSYLLNFLSCLRLTTRSTSSSIVSKPLQQGRESSLSQYQSIGPLLNVDTNLSQVNVFDKDNNRNLGYLGY